MILLWGLTEDACMNMALNELERSGADFVFLDHRKIFSSDIEYTFNAESGEKCILQSDGKTFDLSKIKVVYLRPYNFFDFEEMQNKTIDDPLAIKAAGFEMQLFAYLDASNVVVINKSDSSATNASKPYQLAIIKSFGLNIPETFISNDNEAVRKFLHVYNDTVYKSISGVRSIVQKLSDSHLQYLNDVSWCPTLFQNFIDGVNYRAHVIGDNVITVRIQSDKLDYRYGNTTMIAEELPAEIAEKCRKLNSILGLHFSGIDLMRAAGDQWYCLEVNPSPAYSYFELNGYVPISVALAKYMIDADHR